jgi:hypothetical protein
MLAAMTAAASAQGESQNYLGLKGGLNYTKFYGDEIDDSDFLAGYSIGAFYQYRVSSSFAITPEIYYALRGAKNETTGFELQLGYVDIPVLFKWTFQTSPATTPCIYGGGYYSFLLSAELESEDVKDWISGSDYGLVVGGALDLMIKDGSQLVNFDIRYIWGTSDVGDDSEDPVSFYNGGFQFLVGWGFSL